MDERKEKRFSQPLYQLKNTHELLLGQIGKISQLVSELQQTSLGQEVDEKWYRLYKLAVLFLAQLKIQLFKEEEFLFPLMEQYCNDDDNILLVMDYEHKTVHQKVSQFIETFEKRKKPLNPIEAYSLLSCLELAHTTIVDHIQKEEKLLFPVIEKYLVENEKVQLTEKLAVFE
ncbi:hemerythrin domain-containing protein [Calidifontibacillus erzurumensis]|uniref:Hemerythrin domain-containing protein n=1 Tax=Calidifontibacillus erzurumensis TaxID=2741433 RepID=A0A8J8GEF5_9BACI|nr:hemerythrin domain-containing protein [Calidifontibacillus erzurumensis]NSL51656.1 hemerythrin domain-containing protein [Calidifontibacillus erzurumensis]